MIEWYDFDEIAVFGKNQSVIMKPINFGQVANSYARSREDIP
ncbi:hypothetical protein [Neobacillus niacini]|nr:hypothetical protein [Neobacillus niacini]MDR7001968.1 hypothetical protein [Neobacillus niacini]